MNEPMELPVKRWLRQNEDALLQLARKVGVDHAASLLRRVAFRAERKNIREVMAMCGYDAAFTERMLSDLERLRESLAYRSHRTYHMKNGIGEDTQ